MLYLTKMQLAARWKITVRQVENLVAGGKLRKPEKTPRAEAQPKCARLLRWPLAYIEQVEKETN